MQQKHLGVKTLLSLVTVTAFKPAVKMDISFRVIRKCMGVLHTRIMEAVYTTF